MNVLLLIDLQNDFLPGGALAVAGGDEVVPIANFGIEVAEHVVATQDWHPHDHGSFASQHAGLNVGDSFLLDGLTQVAWPDHCVQGTPGAEFSSKLNVARIDQVIRKGTNPTIDSYSGFFDNGHRQATGLHDHLKEIAKINFGNAHKKPSAQTRSWTLTDQHFANDDDPCRHHQAL